MDENAKEYAKSEMPYTEQDVKELARKVTTIISINKLGEERQLYVKLNLGNIKLNDKISINLNDFKAIMWHSGSDDIGINKLNEKSNVIKGYNSNNKSISIAEFRADIDMDYYLSYFDLALKEYNYKGNDIYIVYKADSYFKEDIGKYSGIMFNVDNIWYQILAEELLDENDQNVDEWINNMCSGVVVFN